MATATRTSDTLIGSVRELIGQTERVARAEAQAAVSQLVDLAVASARRSGILLVGLLFGVCAAAYLIFAAYLALAERVVPWHAAMIVAAGSALLAVLLGWLGSRGGLTRTRTAPRNSKLVTHTSLPYE
jgi:Putative Actinobacterial Holin-X, holin superfamily III